MLCQFRAVSMGLAEVGKIVRRKDCPGTGSVLDPRMRAWWIDA